MYQSYLWQFENIDPSQAQEEFTALLSREQEKYSAAWGFPVDLNIHQQGGILIGHLTTDSGVIDWRSWNQSNGSGVVWNGVCENFLGTRFGEQEIRDTYRKLAQSNGNTNDWDGSFYVISWNQSQNKIFLTTGATDCPTLYYTKGSRGWAAGSRGAPILAMVGHEKQLSPAACNIFMAYGYNYTDQSLFEHVRRVPERTRITLQPGIEPKQARYSTLYEFIEPCIRQANRKSILASCADRLVNRIQRQLQYSSNPEILITGGRDSRCIAAAAQQAGYTGNLCTGGAANSKDAVIGAQVAQRLQLSHMQTPDRVPMAVFGNAIDQLKLWSDMSEGVEVLRHALAYNRFVENQPPENKNLQLFHGLGGEICRGYYYHNIEDLTPLKTNDYAVGRQLLLSAGNPAVHLSRDANNLLEARLDDFSNSFGCKSASVAQWLDMFFWQNSCLRWGGDMLSVKSTMYWAWTPFLDRELISSYWNLDLEDKRSNHFIQDLTLTLATELEGLEYDVAAQRKHGKTSLLSRLSRKLKRPGRQSPSALGKNREITEFWERTLLNAQNPVWSNCLDDKSLRKLIYNNPSSEILWNAATIQLLHDSCS